MRKRSPASIVYLAVFAGAFLSVAALTIVGTTGIVSAPQGFPLLPFRIIGMVLLVLGFVATGVLSGGIPPRGSDADELEWWRANSTRAVSTWATAEGLAILGGVFWLLTRDMIVYVCLVGGGLVLLLLNRPQRLMEG
ncbi:hypothetical protein ACFL3B_05750 [Gemmatimonadota bacterium]